MESRRSDRLFEDPFAEALAGPEGFDLLRRMSAAGRLPGSGSETDNPYLAIRTRFIDDFVQQTIASARTRQVVLVGAGLDSRVFRLDWPAGSRVFELDRPEVLQLKERLLDAAGAHPACDRHAVGIDVTTPLGRRRSELWQVAIPGGSAGHARRAAIVSCDRHARIA